MYSVHEQIEASTAIALDCPSCGRPAQIVDRFTLPGFPGPVEHLKIVCTAGHWFTPPVDSLPPVAPREHNTGVRHRRSREPDLQHRRPRSPQVQAPH